MTKSKRFTKRRVVVLAVVLIIVLPFFIVKIFSSPAVGTVNNKSGQKITKSDTPAYIRHDGETASFAYLESSRFEVSDKNKGNVLESYRIVNKAYRNNPSWITAVSIYRMDSNDLDQISAYRIRQTNASEYIKSQDQVEDKELIVFKKADSTEQTGFFVSKNRLAAITVSGVSINPALEAELKKTIQSWEWK